MPHRIFLVWLGQHDALMTAVLTTASGAVGAVGIWAMNAEGWSAAIGAIGFGVSIFIVRTAPAVAGAVRELTPVTVQFVREVGKGIVDVLAYKKQLMADQVPALVEVQANVTSNKSAIVDLRRQSVDNEDRAVRAEAEAAAAKLEASRIAERLKTEHAAQMQKVYEQMEAMNAESTMKRHALANKLNPIALDLQTDLEEARMEIAALKATIAEIKSRHAGAINATSEGVQAVAAHLKPPLEVETPHLDDSPTIDP
jgi:hypothetical protein